MPKISAQCSKHIICTIIAYRSCSDWTPLHFAVWLREYEEVRSLANDENVNAADAQGWTPLHLACVARIETEDLKVHVNDRGRILPSSVNLFCNATENCELVHPVY